MMEVDNVTGVVGTMAMESKEGDTDTKVSGKAKESLGGTEATAGPILAGRVRSLSFLDKELVRAAERGSLERVKMALEEGAWVDRNNGEAALKAIENGHLEVVKVLFGKSQKHALSYMRCACQYDQAKILEFFLDAGMAVDAIEETENEWQELHEISWDLDEQLEARVVGAQPLHYAAFYGAESCATLLLEKGAAVDARTTTLSNLARTTTTLSNFTPMDLAVISGKANIVQLLIGQKGSVNHLSTCVRGGGWLPSQFDVGPLWWAVQFKRVKIASLLIDAGADDHRQKKKPGAVHPFRFAADMEGAGFEMFKLLVDKGADLQLLLDDEFHRCSKEVHRWLLDEWFDSIPKELLASALSRHVYKSDVEMCQLFIEKGAHKYACGQRWAIFEVKTREILELFLDANAPVNVAMSDGTTLLMRPVVLQDLALTKRLVSLGVNVNAKDKKGRNALWHAANKGGHSEVVRFLKERTAECTLL